MLQQNHAATQHMICLTLPHHSRLIKATWV